MDVLDAKQALVAALAIQCGRCAADTLQAAAGQLVRAVQALPPGFPPGPRHDMALEMAADPLLCMERLKANYGGLAGFKLASQPVVLVTSPKFAREVLTCSNFVKTGTAFFPGSSLAGNGLLVSDGEVWLRQRRLSNPAFRKAVVDTYAEAMTSLTYEMIQSRWKSREIRDVYADFNELTLKIVGTALFRNSAGSTSMAEIVSAITTAFKFFTERATSMFIVPEWAPTPSNIQYHASVASLDRVVYQMINERRLQLASSNPLDLLDKQDLLTRLLQARDSDGSGMDDVSLRDELMTLLVAGQETSSIVLAWCFAMLAAHKEVQERLFLEVTEVLGDKRPSSNDIQKLHYTEAVIWETMRLLPPAYVVGRCASEDTDLGEWHLPAGTTTLVSLYLLHRDPLYWPRAMEFDPDRWLASRGAKSHQENDSYWPFGGGPRNCIGAGFAMMELCLVLAITIRSHRISLPSSSSFPKPQAMITLRPESPLYLEVNPRIAVCTDDEITLPTTPNSTFAFWKTLRKDSTCREWWWPLNVRSGY